MVENAGNISNVGAKRLQLDDSNLYESSNAPSNVTKENDSENLLEDQRLDNDEQKFVNSGDKNEEELDKIIISGADYSESLELTKEISKDVCFIFAFFFQILNFNIFQADEFNIFFI